MNKHKALPERKMFEGGQFTLDTAIWHPGQMRFNPRTGAVAPQAEVYQPDIAGDDAAWIENGERVLYEDEDIEVALGPPEYESDESYEVLCRPGYVKVLAKQLGLDLLRAYVWGVWLMDEEGPEW